MLLSLLACAGFFEIGGERGFRGHDSGEVDFEGWVYSSPALTDSDLMSEGYLAFTLPDGDLVVGEQRYEDYPAYWSVSLPPGVEFDLRIEADGAWPTLWRGNAPESDGIWFAGGMFAADEAYMEALVAALPLGAFASVGDLADGEVAHLWGTPADSGWDCADIRVAEQPVLCVTVSEDGTVSAIEEGEPDWFFAFDLSPGEVLVESGLGGEATYAATGGAWIFALYFYGEAS